MFYSHEILTSRKYGVATVWLIATLGPKSITKKLNRKAILGVNVPKACETILEPIAPMALRLQSNLLYGVSRVYSKQCGYILADAQLAQNHLRALLNFVNKNELDSQAGKTSRGQNLLEDDPAFMLEMAIPALDFEFSDLFLDHTGVRESQGSASMLSPHSSSRFDSIMSDGASLPKLLIPTSDGGGSGYQLPYNDGFQFSGSSLLKMPTRGRLFEDEEQGLIDDFDFEFDADGKMKNLDASELDTRRSSSLLPRMSHLESESLPSGRVGLGYEPYMGGLRQGETLDADGDFIMQLDDAQMILPDAEPFPFGGDGRRQKALSDPSVMLQTESSSVSAEAPLKKRKRKVPRAIPVDAENQLRFNELKTWQTEYLKNMDLAKNQKQAHRAVALAKKKAHDFICGNGLGGVGLGIGVSGPSGPLNTFSGASLFAAVTGVEIPTLSRKRRREDDGQEDEDRQVRARRDIEEDQIGRAREDEGFLPIFDESMGVEVGREAQPALDDHASSVMPWNVSASLKSYRSLGGGMVSSSILGRSTIGGRPSSVLGGRPGSRLASASPLIGRGKTDPGDLERFDELDPLKGGFIDIDTLDKESRNLRAAAIGAEEFELFGPTANVDTQVAQSSNWIKKALKKESLNFLEYVKNTLMEQQEVEGVDNDDNDDEPLLLEDEGVVARKKEVTFETLFPPESNSMMVAAQAFYHVLSLATENKLGVKQVKGYGDIWMNVR